MYKANSFDFYHACCLTAADLLSCCHGAVSSDVVITLIFMP